MLIALILCQRVVNPNVQTYICGASQLLHSDNIGPTIQNNLFVIGMKNSVKMYRLNCGHFLWQRHNSIILSNIAWTTLYQVNSWICNANSASKHVCTIADYCITGISLLLWSSILSLTSRWPHGGWELQMVVRILFQMLRDSYKVHVSWIKINTLIILFHCMDGSASYTPQRQWEAGERSGGTRDLSYHAHVSLTHYVFLMASHKEWGIAR